MDSDFLAYNHNSLTNFPALSTPYFYFTTGQRNIFDSQQRCKDKRVEALVYSILKELETQSMSDTQQSWFQLETCKLETDLYLLLNSAASGSARLLVTVLSRHTRWIRDARTTLREVWASADILNMVSFRHTQVIQDVINSQSSMSNWSTLW